MKLLFEIGCEELPAGEIANALRNIEDHIEKVCTENRLEVGTMRTYATPRRLALTIDEIASAGETIEEVVTGPPARAAFDKDGNPTKAALGFARGRGVDPSALERVETPKGEYVAARVVREGRPAADILHEALEGVFAAIQWKRSMRWGYSELSFSRPVHWIVALLDDTLLTVQYADVEASRMTHGHRFMSDGWYEIDHANDYIEVLRGAKVMVDIDERREAIVEGVQSAAAERGVTALIGEDLLDEVVQLVEWPVPLIGTFPEELLEVPREVLITSMATHQRYFALESEPGKLANYFAFVSNMLVPEPDVVISGNLRVLLARLEDARFFYREDRKTSLADRVQKLSTVTYIDRIGSVLDRTERIEKLASKLASSLYAGDEAVASHAARAAHLCKADLLTGMVYEFPELQGTMGRYYATADGEPSEVAAAIEEHYQPRGASDDPAESPAGICVALAEKLDAIVGCFALGLIPSGSADPYALRRAALGIIRTSIARGVRLDLTDLVGSAYDTLPEADLTGREETISQVVEFIAGRVKAMLASDVPTDIADAVVAVAMADLPTAPERAAVLDRMRENADFLPLAAGFKRVMNILRQAKDKGFAVNASAAADAYTETSERALFEAWATVEASTARAFAEGHFDEGAKNLIGLKGSIDTFFDDVMVFADDESVREARLGLLTRIADGFLQLADISRIQVNS